MNTTIRGKVERRRDDKVTRVLSNQAKAVNEDCDERRLFSSKCHVPLEGVYRRAIRAASVFRFTDEERFKSLIERAVKSDLKIERFSRTAGDIIRAIRASDKVGTRAIETTVQF